MIKTYTAYTMELDDAELAVSEILSQLQPDKNRLKNTIGIISCHDEFIISGAYKAVCEALPFETVGAVSSASAVAGVSDNLMLTVMMITSDNTEFSKAVSEPLTGNAGDIVTAAYKKASAGRDEKPALILIYSPFMRENAGDDYAAALSEASGGAPVFGTIATDDNMYFKTCCTLDCGGNYEDKIVLMLFYGDFTPTFYVAGLSKEKILNKSGVITKSEGHIIKEINNRPVMEFFKELGLEQAVRSDYAMSALPFVMDYNDGTPPVAKVFIRLTPEEYALCAAACPEGNTINIATNDENDILLTSGNAAEEIANGVSDKTGLLIYSCVGRFLTFVRDRLAEIKIVDEKIGTSIPYMMSYSGGEFCPTAMGSEAINRFHNNTLIALKF